MEQDIVRLLEERPLRMAPLSGQDPWARVGPKAPPRKSKVAILASVLFVVAAGYLLMHFIP